MQLELLASSNHKGCNISRYKINISTFQCIANNALSNDYIWGRSQGWATILWFISGSIPDVLPLPHLVCKHIYYSVKYMVVFLVIFIIIIVCVSVLLFYYYYSLVYVCLFLIFLFFRLFVIFVLFFVWYCTVSCFFYWNCPINTNCNIQFYKIG